jgi:DeoR/GlpR family transcriptional regulator of sugar metabolism
MSKKRIDAISELLLADKKVVVSQLAAMFHVSAVTIRNDLVVLENRGFSKRIHGGAVLTEKERGNGSDDADFYSDSTRIALARSAFTEIKDDDCIFLGSGTTCCVLARLLKGFRNLTVITNNITALTDLLENVSRVYLVGGEVTSVDHKTLLSSWEKPDTFLDNIFVNKAFTSISGLDFKAGLTVNSIISTHIYRHIPSMSHCWYLIADSEKFDRIAIYPVAELGDVQVLISDHVPDEYLNYFREKDVRVIFSKP